LFLAQLREVLDGFVDSIVADIIGRRFGSKIGAIADVLFG